MATLLGFGPRLFLATNRALKRTWMHSLWTATKCSVSVRLQNERHPFSGTIESRRDGSQMSSERIDTSVEGYLCARETEAGNARSNDSTWSLWNRSSTKSTGFYARLLHGPMALSNVPKTVLSVTISLVALPNRLWLHFKRLSVLRFFSSHEFYFQHK